MVFQKFCFPVLLAIITLFLGSHSALAFGKKRLTNPSCHLTVVNNDNINFYNDQRLGYLADKGYFPEILPYSEYEMKKSSAGLAKDELVFIPGEWTLRPGRCKATGTLMVVASAKPFFTKMPMERHGSSSTSNGDACDAAFKDLVDDLPVCTVKKAAPTTLASVDDLLRGLNGSTQDSGAVADASDVKDVAAKANLDDGHRTAQGTSQRID